MSDPYVTLGVRREASRAEIDEAFQRAADDALSQDRLLELESAYRTLADPARRFEYDRSLNQHHEPFSAPEPEPAFERPPEQEPAPEPPAKVHHSRNPVDRLTRGLPQPWRVIVDWVVTIAGAILIVLAIKSWVVNPYRIPSSSMEPTLHCAIPASGCEARFSDRVLANRFIYHLKDPERGDIVVFETPLAARERCGAGGTFVKRIIGLPGERLELRNVRGLTYVFIDGRRLEEPYLAADRRDSRNPRTFLIPEDNYFMMGDNRGQSCDSREWGTVPRDNLIGKVFATYWPPNRISIR